MCSFTFQCFCYFFYVSIVHTRLLLLLCSTNHTVKELAVIRRDVWCISVWLCFAATLYNVNWQINNSLHCASQLRALSCSSSSGCRPTPNLLVNTGQQRAARSAVGPSHRLLIWQCTSVYICNCDEAREKLAVGCYTSAVDYISWQMCWATRHLAVRVYFDTWLVSWPHWTSVHPRHSVVMYATDIID